MKKVGPTLNLKNFTHNPKRANKELSFQVASLKHPFSMKLKQSPNRGRLTKLKNTITLYSTSQKRHSDKI